MGDRLLVFELHSLLTNYIKDFYIWMVRSNCLCNTLFRIWPILLRYYALIFTFLNTPEALSLRLQTLAPFPEWPGTFLHFVLRNFIFFLLFKLYFCKRYCKGEE